MINKTKKKFQQYVSPEGVWIWPYLCKADTKFNPDGEYRVKLRLSEEELNILKNTLEKEWEVVIEEAEEEFADLSKAVRDTLGSITYKDLGTKVFNDQDEPTGEYDVTFKAPASGVDKNGKRWFNKVAVFDSRKHPLPSDVIPFGGSTGKIAFTVKPYFFKATAQAGLKLRLVGAQVTNLVQQGERSADSFGFEEIDDGFDASELDIPSNNTDDIDIASEEDF